MENNNIKIQKAKHTITSPHLGGLGGCWDYKQNIRNKIRRLKASYTHDELMQMSHQLCKAVINTPQWHDASTVLLYSSLPDEVNTQDLIDAAQREEKRVLLPVVVGDDLILRQFTGDYIIGAFNINEPIGSEFTDYSEIDLAIIPGMAFDYNNNRLGRGKGYYDRLLSRIDIYKNSLPTGRVGESLYIGLCFPFQYIDKQDISKDSPFGGWGALPFGGCEAVSHRALAWQAEPHDIKMDFVIH